MKKLSIILAALLVFAAASCKKQPVQTQTRKFTFHTKGFYLYETPTRGTLSGDLTADGYSMTDLWVFDYVNGELQQQIHQQQGDDDWGEPVMYLTLGQHHIYFVASRGLNPTVSTPDKTITFTKPSDSFWCDYQVNVTSTSNGNRAVTLDRVVTRLRLTFTDAIPEGATSIACTPETWYFGINYQTGEPCASQSTGLTINVPSNLWGLTDQMATFYGFSSATEWTTDVTVQTLAGNNVVGACLLEDAPFRRNRMTHYTGNMFTSGGTTEVSLNSDWLDPYEGGW